MAVERYRVSPNTKTVNNPGTYTKEKETKTVRKVVGIKRFEIGVYLVMLVLIAVCAFYLLSLKMDAYALQSDIFSLDSDIATTESEIHELNTEVTDLSSYDRIYEKANDLGLDLDNGNVKVVEKYDKD